MRREGASYFYHYDGLGSVRQLTGKRICLIATAVYGTSLAPEVEALSRLRDEYLLTSELGRRFVAFCYRHSPALAEFISRREWAKKITRLALLPLVRIAELIVGEENAASASNPNPNPSRATHQRQFNRNVSIPPPSGGGTIKAEYTYCAFGNLIEGNDHESPYGFTGEQQFREAAGLIFLRARYYDPSTGRFISRDPWTWGPNDPRILMTSGHQFSSIIKHMVLAIGTARPQFQHPYIYVLNNPINMIDPSGLYTQGVGITFSFGFVPIGRFVQIMYVWDDDNNRGIAFARGGGGFIIAGVGAQFTYQYTTTDTIYDLREWAGIVGFGFGGPAPVKFLGFGVEAIVGEGFRGFDIIAGPSLGFPFGMWGYLGFTKVF
jgi:RHS repeat-associated protein